jgi:hypothetical protein
MSNMIKKQRPSKLNRRARRAQRAYVTYTLSALVVVSMTWYSHSLTPGAGGSKKSLTAAGQALDSTRMIAVQHWAGRKFMVLDKPKLFRKFGYELYLTKDLSTSIRRIDTSFETDRHHLRYDRGRNTVLTVSAAEPVAGEWLVSFLQTGTGLSLYGKTHRGAIEGIASLEDIDKSAERWVGRFVFSRRRFIDTYDSANGTFGTVKVNIQDRLKVTGVRWGTTPLPPKPIWLCVTTREKETGIIPIAQTWTNVMVDKITSAAGGPNPWDEDIFDTNPQQIYSWDSTTWKAINSHTINSGMTKEQVRVSWGQPQRIMTDTAKTLCGEQWLYGSQYLCLDHDTVSSVGGR